MKKIIAVSLILFGLFSSSAKVLAALELKNWPNSPLGTPLNESTNIVFLVRYFYEWGISLGGLTVFIVLVSAGFQYLTSTGSAEKMKQAMDKIKSAVIGLALLLGSVLILNTINPQLTQLKVPQTTPLGDYLVPPDTIKVTVPENKPCEGATLYSAPEYKGEALAIESGEYFNEPRTINSVDFNGKGNCFLWLFYLKDFDENDRYQAVLLYIDTPNVAAVFNKTNFRSGKLINNMPNK